MAKSGFSQLITWAATLVGHRGKADGGEPSAGTLEEQIERVRAASMRVGGQSDATILEESRRLGPLVTQLLRGARACIAPGATTLSVADALVARCRREGLEPAMLGYQGYPAGAAVSVNEEILHGIPSSRVLRDADLVKVEFGVVSGKAFASQSWTFPVGKVSEEDALMIDAARRALRAAVAAVRPGGRLGDIGAAIQETAEAAGLSPVKAFVGYGMGKKRMQAPQIPTVGRRGLGERLRAGSILNVHVIVKHGSFDIEIGPNKWTALAGDGRRGALFTAMVEVTPEGHVELTGEVAV